MVKILPAVEYRVDDTQLNERRRSHAQSFQDTHFIFSFCLLVAIFASARPAGGQAAGPDNKRGGELIISIVADTPIHLNPAIHSGSAIGMPGAQIFASPLRYDKKWRPRPYLAEKWQISEDGLSLTLHLAKNATFHDGAPVTSRDVAFSVKVVKENHPFKTVHPVRHVGGGANLGPQIQDTSVQDTKGVKPCFFCPKSTLSIRGSHVAGLTSRSS